MHNRPIKLFVIIGIIFVSLLALVGCGDTPSSAELPKTIRELVISKDFTFQTTERISIDHLFGPKFSNIPIAIYGSAYDTFSEDQPIKDFVVGYRITDSEGRLKLDVTVPSSCLYLVLNPNYIGLTEVRIPLGPDEKLLSRARIGNKGSGPTYTFSSLPLPKPLGDRIKAQPDEYWWTVNDEYSSDGIPKSLFSIDLEKDFLKDVNNSLFKRNKDKDDKDVPPELIAGLGVGALDMSADNDVWITFVDEKAGFNNTFGYYSYPTAKKPDSIDVDDITLVFPNASYGKKRDTFLESGDSVYIGKIRKGQSLGFVLITNGWYSGGKDNAGQVRKDGHQGIYYSQANLNPEKEPHASIIHYGNKYGDKVFLLGMEDDKHKKNDYNFNDVVFAIIVGDKALVSNRIPSFESTPDFEGKDDKDGDGVIDALDAYPNDPLRTTKEILTGTLAYEDLWPELGDYDFNDLVIGYEYAIDGNKENKIVSMDLKFTILASGASVPNGLALALPVKKSAFAVSDLTYSKSGTVSSTAVVKENENGDRSQILIFERQDRIMGRKTFNTDYKTQKLDPQSVSFTLTFEPAITRDTLDAAPFDVFMLVDNAEKASNPQETPILVREVHLIGFDPTSLANQKFLKLSNENKNDKHYRSEHYLPWAIHIPGAWDYPLEKKSIVDATTTLERGQSLGETSTKIGTLIRKGIGIVATSINQDGRR